MDTCVSAVRTYYADKDTVPDKVKIYGTKGSELKGNDTDNAALKDGGCANSIVKGAWTGEISAEIDMKTGAVTYAGTATYYKADGDKGFVAVTPGASK